MKDNSFTIQTYRTKINIRKFYSIKKSNYKISNDCYIDIIILNSSNKMTNVLITGDLIWFSKHCTDKIRNYISKNLSLKKENIVLSASHTHGTPNPEKAILSPLFSKRFDNYLINLIYKSFLITKFKAKKNVFIEFRRTFNNEISINRRRSALSFSNGIEYKMQNLPNFRKKVDNIIDIFDFVNQRSKKIEATIIKANCHPVSSPQDTKGADYIGFLKKKLFTGSNNILFLQGFCGDIRPKMIKSEVTLKDHLIRILIGKRFRKTKNSDAKNLGYQIVNSVNNAKKRRFDFLINSNLKSSEISLTLELENGKTHKSPLKITCWRWGQVYILFLNAEVLSGYNIKNISGLPVTCVGYSNGMIGYLPTKADIEQGGYEVDKSRKNFQIKNKIALKSERLITNEINSLLRS